MKFQFHSQQRSRWPYRRFKNLARMFVEKAKVYRHEGESEKSLAYFNWASRLDSGNLEYLWVIADFWDEQDAEKAVAVLSRIIEVAIDAENLERAHSRRAFSYGPLGKHIDSVADLDWLINHGFGSEIRLDYRAECHLELGNIQSAIEDSSEAIRLAPEVVNFVLRRGRFYYRGELYEEALKDFNTVIEMSKEVYKSDVVAAYTYMWRGRAYYKLGKHKEALDDFNEDMCLSRGPAFSDATVYMRTFYPEDVNE